MLKKIFLALIPLVYLFTGSFAQQMHHDTNQNIRKAIAVLTPTKGNNVKGTVIFQKVDNGIKVTLDIEGLTPGKHGFHIHQYGDCSAPDAETAGGHYNPTNQPHGGPDMKSRHIGDFGNITADSNGKVHMEMTDSSLSFDGKNSIIGHAVIIHAKEDDLKTQPSGNSGQRVACGVIGIAKE